MTASWCLLITSDLFLNSEITRFEKLAFLLLFNHSYSQITKELIKSDHTLFFQVLLQLKVYVYMGEGGICGPLGKQLIKLGRGGICDSFEVLCENLRAFL